ncbi:type II toxin-antitoxin system Phd/YefM family antitoxin [Streptomyces sp. NBC_00370]
MSEFTMTDARAKLGTLVRRVAHSHERIAITDHGHVAAVLINAHDLEDLEDARALAEYQAEKANGTLVTVPHEEVKRMLGIEHDS